MSQFFSPRESVQYSRIPYRIWVDKFKPSEILTRPGLTFGVLLRLLGDSDSVTLTVSRTDLTQEF
jgi:hypothetical protein